MTTATNEDFKGPFSKDDVVRPWRFCVNTEAWDWRGERVESRYQYVFMGWDLTGIPYYEKKALEAA